MQLYLLHLDNALKSQPSFLELALKNNAQQIEAVDIGAEIRLWGKDKKLHVVSEKLREHFTKNGSRRQLCFMGSGDFHHVTALLLAAALEYNPEPTTVIHFDNHPGWVRYKSSIHCCSWVNKAVKYPQLEKVVTIGVTSKDLKNPDWKGENLSLMTAGKLGLFPFKAKPSQVKNNMVPVLAMARKKSVKKIFVKCFWRELKPKMFISRLIKDVLSREDALTNWDQGVMRLPFLLLMLAKIGEHHNIIGADVTGDYSTPVYSGNAWVKFAKRAEIFIDQPHETPDAANAAKINSPTNHTLFKTLPEIMA